MIPCPIPTLTSRERNSSNMKLTLYFDHYDGTRQVYVASCPRPDEGQKTVDICNWVKDHCASLGHRVTNWGNNSFFGIETSQIQFYLAQERDASWVALKFSANIIVLDLYDYHPDLDFVFRERNRVF